MANNSYCTRTELFGDTVRIEDIKILDAESRAATARRMSELVFKVRLAAVVETGDARHMFELPEQHQGYSEGELGAFALYAKAGRYDELVEGSPIIAYESLRTLHGDINPRQEDEYHRNHAAIYPPSVPIGLTA